MAGGKMHTRSSSYPPGSAPGHKLQKPSKESGIFQSLGTINFVLFSKKRSQKGGAWPNAPYLLNSLVALSTHNQKCANKMQRIFLYLIAYLSSNHEKATNVQHDLAWDNNLAKHSKVRVKILNKICLKIMQKALKWPFRACKFSCLPSDRAFLVSQSASNLFCRKNKYV